MQQDLLLAPGSLFSPNQLPSTRMRLNVAALRGNLAARRMRAEISEDMSRSDLMKAQRLAREWLTTH